MHALAGILSGFLTSIGAFLFIAPFFRDDASALITWPVAFLAFYAAYEAFTWPDNH